jgi:hypothetical protein
VQVLAAVGQPYGTLFGTSYTRDASGKSLLAQTVLLWFNNTKKYLGKYTPDWLGKYQQQF